MLVVRLLRTGVWSRSRRLGLGTVSRRTNVSSQSRLGQNPQRLGLGPMRLGFLLGLGAICLGLGPVGLVSDLGPLCLVSSRRFVQARAVHTVVCSCS